MKSIVQQEICCHKTFRLCTRKVIIDKPISLHLHESKEIAELAEEKGLIAMVGLNNKVPFPSISDALITHEICEEIVMAITKRD